MQLEVLWIAVPEEQEQKVLMIWCREVMASPKHKFYMAWTRTLMMEMNAL